MAEKTTTTGLQVEYNETSGIKRTSQIGLMVEHLDSTINFRRIGSTGLKVEYYQTPNVSFISNPISYDMIVVNTLETVVMIAEDEKEFTYNIVNQNGYAYDLTNYSLCYVSFFKYGNPYDVLFTISGDIISPLEGKFSIALSDSLTSSLSGVYIQQIKFVDINIKTHIIAQGKIIILPKS